MKASAKSIRPAPRPFPRLWGVDHDIKAVHFFYFMAFGCYLPYANLYFGRLGFSGAEIGLLTAIPPIATLVAPPVVGALADVTQRRREVLRALLLTVAGVFAILLTVRDWVGVVVVMVCYGLAFSPLVPLMDSITLQHLDGRSEQYGSYRLWGSIGFMVGSLAVGGLISRWGAEVWIYAYVVSSSIAAVLAGRLPRGAAAGQRAAGHGGAAPIEAGRTSASRSGPVPGASSGARVRAGLRRAAGTLDDMWQSLLSVTRKPDLAMFFVGVLFVFLAGATYHAFFSIYLDEMNVPERWIGTAWTIGVGSEVLMMLGSVRLLRRMGAKRLFCLGALGAALRWFLYATVDGVGVILVAQTLHAFSFAAVFIGAVNLVNDKTPSGRQASAQSVLNAVSQGLALAVGALVAGSLSDALGIRTLFSYSAVLALVGAAFVWLFVDAPDGADRMTAQTGHDATKGA